MAFIGRQQPEITKVGVDTEVRIPALTAIVGALALDVVIFGTFLIALIYLLWRSGWIPAWAWAGEWWGLWIIALLVPWGIFGVLLAVSFAVQTIDKHSPSPRKQREANDGILSAWGIFKRDDRSDGDYRREFGGGDDE